MVVARASEMAACATRVRRWTTFELSSTTMSWYVFMAHGWMQVSAGW